MKIAFHTLGCKVNQYETEAMKKMFEEKGNEIVGEEEFAHVYVVNTCTVTSLADRKSRQYIRRMKKINPDAIVAVTGCYVQSGREALEAMEEIDIILGTNEKYNLIDHVIKYREECLGGATLGKEVIVHPYSELTEFVEAGNVVAPETMTRAYVKIQEGCNRFCSYCVIPMARGPVRSRPMDNIVNEVKSLIEAGYKEVVLTGINTALYEDLLGLLDRLEELDGDFRIRLSSLEPTVVDSEFVKKLRKYKRLCHHLHLSLQSGSDKIIAAMNRHYDRKEYMDIVEILKDFDPLYGITTDIIVGFPGEDEQDFADTLELSEKVGFSKIHVFKYSKRPGTKAENMPGQISPVVKKERGNILGKKGDELALEFYKKHIGKEVVILVEEYEGEYQVGYTDNYIKAHFISSEDHVNTFVKGICTKVDDNGLYVEI